MVLNILIVDDSATSRSYIQKNLELVELPNVSYFHAKNGKMAYDLMKAQKVDLLFLDINMPEMNGVELIEKLHGEGRLQGLEVFIVSTEGSEPRIAYLKSMGVRHFLRKPFSPELFSGLIGDYMGRKVAC